MAHLERSPEPGESPGLVYKTVAFFVDFIEQLQDTRFLIESLSSACRPGWYVPKGTIPHDIVSCCYTGRQ